MPPKKNKQANEEKLKLGRQAKLEKEAVAESDTALNNLQSSFRESKAYTTQLEQQLADQVQICTDLQNNLNTSHDLINTLRTEILSLKSKNSDIYHQLRMERQRNKRTTSKHSSMASQILLLKKADAISSAQLSKGLRDSATTITKLLKMNEDLRTELSQSVKTWSTRTEALTEAAKSKLMSSDTRLKNAQKEVSKLRKGFRRATLLKEHAVETAKAKVIQKKSVHHLSHKGVFTQKTRNLVCFLSQSGCSANRINEIITAVLNTAGITVVGSISRTSVARIIREGYFAAQIQLGHEMKMAETMTFSADGTGHRSINYNSRHAHMLVENYGSSGSGKTRATRFLGIKPSRDGSSKEAIADWQMTITEILDLYNRSPFGKRSGGTLIGLVDILIKLTGMNTDHCAKEKKDAYEMEELKKWAVNQHLGEEAMLEKSLQEIYGLQMHKEKWFRPLVDNKSGKHCQRPSKLKSVQRWLRMWFRNWERVYLSYLIHMKSAYFDFSFGPAVDVIRISIRCGVDIQQWRSGGKNIILKAQFCLLTETMTWFLRREIKRLLMEMKSHLHKSKL